MDDWWAPAFPTVATLKQRPHTQLSASSSEHAKPVRVCVRSVSCATQERNPVLTRIAWCRPELNKSGSGHGGTIGQRSTIGRIEPRHFECTLVAFQI